LTWQNQRALVWNLATLHKEREISYQGEGGSLFRRPPFHHDDGSDTLALRDAESFAKSARSRSVERTSRAQSQ